MDEVMRVVTRSGLGALRLNSIILGNLGLWNHLDHCVTSPLGRTARYRHCWWIYKELSIRYMFDGTKEAWPTHIQGLSIPRNGSPRAQSQYRLRSETSKVTGGRGPEKLLPMFYTSKRY